MQIDPGKSRNILVAVFLAALAGCTVGCFIALTLLHRQPPPSSHEEIHEWLHHELGLTGEQQALLTNLEQNFSVEEKLLRTRMANANLELATAIREDQTYTPRVERALDEVQVAESALRKATITHLLEMRTAISDEQYQKLLKLTTEALTNTTPSHP